MERTGRVSNPLGRDSKTLLAPMSRPGWVWAALTCGHHGIWLKVPRHRSQRLQGARNLNPSSQLILFLFLFVDLVICCA